MIKNLKVNLADEVRKFATPKQIRAFLPFLKNETIKREIGARIVNAIVERTLSGKDKHGEDFSGRAGRYSQSYRESDVFKIFKGGKRKPNLKLFGDMLASIDVVSIQGNTISIGFLENEEKRKADGHVSGNAGRRGWALPIRDFWGLPNTATMSTIIKDAIREYEDETLLFIAESVEEASDLFILNLGVT